MGNSRTKLAPLYIKGPSGRIHIDDGGTGGLPVVFAHSFGGSAVHWEHQLRYLRPHQRAVAIDFRGHGQSDDPSDESYAAESLAADIAAVVDHLRLERFVLVGHSMGGAAAIAYADAHPERVAGLLLAGTPGKTPEEMSKPIIAALESEAYEKVMDDYMKQLLANAEPDVYSLVLKESHQLSKDTSLHVIRSLFEYNPLPALDHYIGPVKLLSTAREIDQPHSLPNQMPDIPHEVFEGTSHWVQMDKPSEFNRVLDAFLEAIEHED